jgi:hypothetical protein
MNHFRLCVEAFRFLRWSKSRLARYSVVAALHFLIGIHIRAIREGSKPPFCPTIYPADQNSLSSAASLCSSLDCT